MAKTILRTHDIRRTSLDHRHICERISALEEALLNGKAIKTYAVIIKVRSNIVT